MRLRVKKLADYGSPQLNQAVQDVQACLDTVLDSTVHKVTAVWQVPFVLRVPFSGGIDRLTSPAFVACHRAKNLTDGTILVTPGGVAFDWVGNGQVRIDDVSGLTVGQKYELTFEAVG